jgi:predicted nucleic acid-binding Zn ribbon protein
MTNSSVTTCVHCGTTFTARRSDARYCSPRCRVAALRERRHPTQRRRQPLTEQFTHQIVAIDKHITSLEKDTATLLHLIHDDRLTANRSNISATNSSDIQRAIHALTTQADTLRTVNDALNPPQPLQDTTK